MSDTFRAFVVAVFHNHEGYGEPGQISFQGEHLAFTTREDAEAHAATHDGGGSGAFAEVFELTVSGTQNNG